MKSQILRMLIIGAPGSGKGTIASRIVRDFGLLHLSSGDLLRAQIAAGTKAGIEAKRFIDAGTLVPDEPMTELIVAELQKLQKSWLLDDLSVFVWFQHDNKEAVGTDLNLRFVARVEKPIQGYPRTVNQAKALQKHHALNLVLNLDVPFPTIRERLELRWIHAPSGRVYHTEWNPPKNPGVDDVTGEPLIQRDDDKPETVTARLYNHQKQTEPVLDFYKKLNILKSFHGTESNVIYPKMKEFLTDFMKENQ